jgi:hypothetical protein
MPRRFRAAMKCILLPIRRAADVLTSAGIEVSCFTATILDAETSESSREK